MGLNFRKSFKIAPGVKLNVGKKGISSVSVGVKGARVSLGKTGTRTTVGIPGTGLSYSSFKSNKTQPKSLPSNYQQHSFADTTQVQSKDYKKVSFLLGFGIFWMPYIFAWFTLRKGHSSKARWISFIWMILVLIIAMSD
ncbi:hypothetical protein B9T33_11505 [Acinetobacter sp. ANC 5054]|uniref:DUF4236 domain-containing protein n=1 Tax=Acinetobacter sp. ANC 5054 TaxID=1977877 RepID=UPI000A344677|nr:hypothetical protein B9T33_11505 [Acinetobacter sp. ANC 5054]